MGRMTGVERLLKTLNLEEPDTVPTFDIHDSKVRDAILPGGSYEEFVEHLDLDRIISIDKVDAWEYETVDETNRIARDQWGGLTKFSSELLGHPIAPAMKSEKDLEGYVPPDPDDPKRYVWLEQVVKRFKGERAICVLAADAFNIPPQCNFNDGANFGAAVISLCSGSHAC